LRLARFFDAEDREVRVRPEEVGVWTFDEDDWLLYAMLADPVYIAELFGSDAGNHDYAGQFVVRDYQYPLFREMATNLQAACARAVGKTESIKWKALTKVVKRIGQNLLVTAPELIHLLPLTDAIEDKIRSIRLFREFLQTYGGKTGFTHRPFGVDFADGTKIVGRIPRLTGTGVKGQHQPDCIVDEGQDYPDAGWVELQETLMRETVDLDGNPDWTFHIYGVHTGARDSGFYKRATGGGYKLVRVTKLQTLSWGKSEKDEAKAAYGGTSAPDYRRNILGEPGAAASAYFVTSRLVLCVDQDRETHYNTVEYKHVLIRVEEFDELLYDRKDREASAELIGQMLDLPSGYKNVWGGMDVGLTNSPTVITLFSEEKVKTAMRLKLFRRITLERMRVRTIREALYAIGFEYGTGLKGFGMDITGLGFPIWQEMEDDESAPAHLWTPDGGGVARGYFFNAKMPVGVDKSLVTEDKQGRMRDHLGAAVVAVEDPLTNTVRYETYMPMIESSTRYLREFVDTNFMLLPFDTEITGDMQGETQQRVKRIAGLKNKPNAFHILDSMRAMAQRYKEGDVAEQMEYEKQVPVLDMAL
jgi:hypothetical protein